jgi:hypothetical protein
MMLLRSGTQREWAATCSRATFWTPIAVEDVLNSRTIAYPFVSGTQYRVSD